MTKAEKMAEKFWESTRVTLLPDHKEIMQLIQQVAERTLREVLLLGWHIDDEMNIASCRWWEDEAK